MPGFSYDRGANDPSAWTDNGSSLGKAILAATEYDPTSNASLQFTTDVVNAAAGLYAPGYLADVSGFSVPLATVIANHEAGVFTTLTENAPTPGVGDAPSYTASDPKAAPQTSVFDLDDLETVMGNVGLDAKAATILANGVYDYTQTRLDNAASQGGAAAVQAMATVTGDSQHVLSNLYTDIGNVGQAASDAKFEAQQRLLGIVSDIVGDVPIPGLGEIVGETTKELIKTSGEYAAQVIDYGKDTMKPDNSSEQKTVKANQGIVFMTNYQLVSTLGSKGLLNTAVQASKDNPSQQVYLPQFTDGSDTGQPSVISYHKYINSTEAQTGLGNFVDNLGDGSEFQGADHTASGSAQADASQ
jgi:hypothetical protein